MFMGDNCSLDIFLFCQSDDLRLETETEKDNGAGDPTSRESREVSHQCRTHLSEVSEEVRACSCSFIAGLNKYLHLVFTFQ